jgi:hypothetical protein
MNCRKCNEKILLYHELDEEDKRAVDDHVLSCNDCAEELQRIIQAFQILGMLKKDYESTVRSPDMTDKVMRAIRKERATQPPLPYRLFAVTSFDYVRYSLAAASLFFIVLFVFESTYTATQSRPQIASNLNIQKDIQLNTTDFAAGIKDKIENESPRNDRRLSSSLYACIQSCRKNVKTSECATCLNNYVKSYRYENL